MTPNDDLIQEVSNSSACNTRAIETRFETLRFVEEAIKL